MLAAPQSKRRPFRRINHITLLQFAGAALCLRNMQLPHYPDAQSEARQLVDKHDGRAEHMVEMEIDDRLKRDDVEAALKLDQVRREIERIYEHEGA